MFSEFEDRGSMEFVYEQKVGFMDVLKDVFLTTIRGESSPLYTQSVSIY